MHYYQFNIADYRKDTVHLTPMEHYIYRWLIDQYYLNEQPLNAGSSDLCRLMGLPRDSIHESMVTSLLYEFFEPVLWSKDSEFYDEQHPDEVMMWKHERIDQQIEEYQEFIDRQSRAGKASAKKRAEKKSNSGSTKSNGGSTSVQPTTNHKPLTNNQDKENKQKKVERPADVQVQVWDDFLKHRKRLRADLSETALKGIVREANKAGWKLEDALTECVSRGWRSFKADWVEENKNSRGLIGNDLDARRRLREVS